MACSVSDKRNEKPVIETSGAEESAWLTPHLEEKDKEKEAKRGAMLGSASGKLRWACSNPTARKCSYTMKPGQITSIASFANDRDFDKVETCIGYHHVNLR